MIETLNIQGSDATIRAEIIDTRDWTVDIDRGAKQVAYLKAEKSFSGNPIYGTFIGRWTDDGWRVEQHHHNYRTREKAIAKLNANR